MNEHLIFTDERKFLEIVRTTDDLLEAEEMLRGAKRAIVDAKEKLVLKRDTSLDQPLAHLLRMVNDEIHFISKRVTMTDWRDVVTELWGEEGLAQIRVRLAALTAQRKQTRVK